MNTLQITTATVQHPKYYIVYGVPLTENDIRIGFLDRMRIHFMTAKIDPIYVTITLTVGHGRIEPRSRA